MDLCCRSGLHGASQACPGHGPGESEAKVPRASDYSPAAPCLSWCTPVQADSSSGTQRAEIDQLLLRSRPDSGRIPELDGSCGHRPQDTRTDCVQGADSPVHESPAEAEAHRGSLRCPGSSDF